LARWSSAADDEGFAIKSKAPCVVTATLACPHCGDLTEVICIHCLSGVVLGQSLERFTVSDINAVDEALHRELQRWPCFYRSTEEHGLGDFTNHCDGCGEAISDMDLHSEPDQVFFDVAHAPEGSVQWIPLRQTIQLSGNEHFVIE
jgi:hypothetical protein